MRARTSKRAAQERVYRRLRDEYLAEHEACERCGLPSEELHHKRGRVGADLTDATHFAALCRACHRWAGEHPTDAIRLGISEKRIGIAS